MCEKRKGTGGKRKEERAEEGKERRKGGVAYPQMFSKLAHMSLVSHDQQNTIKYKVCLYLMFKLTPSIDELT